ncbi:MAG: multicopper oxidase family protein [Selenomonadaceae bacterium]
MVYGKKWRSYLATAVVALFTLSATAQASDIKLDIKESVWELKPGLSTNVWTYNGSAPGTPIVVREGEKVVIEGINHLPVTTNIHWHGLVVPNDQDGPSRIIKPGASFRYVFTAKEAGTYWYHSHYRPVLTQVDMGLYAPFIVKTNADDKYSGDHILVFDDWYLDKNGNRLLGTARGNMERYGNIETVNGKTADAIEPLVFRTGELHKLRFINASTAAYHTMHLDGHRFRVTHTDGHPLVEAYMTDKVTLAPGERIDVEVAADGKEGDIYHLKSDRPELGINIPIKYKGVAVAPITSPFVPPVSKGFSDIVGKIPDYVLELGSRMIPDNTGQKSSMHDMAGMHDMSMKNNMGMMSKDKSAHKDMQIEMSRPEMQWTINGKIFPKTDPLKVTVNQVVKVRFWNKDTQGMHPMDHPIHLHGTYFEVVSLNGEPPKRETWKDTINVPAGEYVDVAFKMEEAGMWMLHCHILDHEDGGMMTMIEVKTAK